MRRKRRISTIRIPTLCSLFFLIIAGAMHTGSAQEDKNKKYEITEPGTITFTEGIKIKGKFEKPQVMILLLKEKSQYREMEFTYSFENDIFKPLPFIPLAPIKKE